MSSVQLVGGLSVLVGWGELQCDQPSWRSSKQGYITRLGCSACARQSLAGTSQQVPKLPQLGPA